MPLSKKGDGWEHLSADFEEPPTKIPRREYKKAKLPKEIAPPEVTIRKKPRNNIESLAKLLSLCDPKETADLSLSKQKQRELDDWFSKASESGKPRVLVLSGPSGCGKTAALKVIAKENDYDILEWTTPLDSGPLENYFVGGQSNKFLDFLIRATHYNSLLSQNSRRLILVKDIPNVYFMKPEEFFTVLQSYFDYGQKPLVFACIDGATSRILSTLFPTEIISQFNIDRINVPAATQPAMKKTLKRIADILNTNAGHIINVTQENIDEGVSNSVGDVRSAVLNLIFNSLKVSDKTLKRDCGVREEGLGLLHGIGRVINPKRIEAGDGWTFLHNPDDIASYFQSQSGTFLHFLHENYINTMSRIEDIESCSEIMSLSDTLSREWQNYDLTKLNLSFCIRGVMVANEKPATRWNPVRKPRSEKPTLSRNLGVAEKNWYRSIIRPHETLESQNLDGTVIEQDSD